MTASAMAARPVATPSARASDSSDVNTKRHRGRPVRPLRGERSRGSAFASSARRRVAEAPRALSDPVETESKAERFLREQLEREGVDVDAAVAQESPEEIVSALEEEEARLAEREASLTRDLDAAYRDTFADLVVQVPSSTGGDGGDEGDAPRTESFSCPKDIDEASFRALAAADAAAASALLDAAQKGDQAKWLAFQRNAHMAKLQRDRVVAQKAAVQAEIAVAKRGGGAVAAAEAAAKAARDAAAKAESARAENLGGLAPDLGLGTGTRRIVLISGFESFNVKLYRRAARNLAKRCPGVELAVFSDRDVEANRKEVAAALDGAEVFFGSLLFDFDQVEWLRDAVSKIPTRFVFESALELMSETSVGSFEMKPAPDGEKAGPPPAVKAILAKFGSGKEEDKLVGYLSFLKLGPALLKFVPGRKAKDLRNWLTVYGYWNQGGLENVEEAFYYVAREYLPGLPNSAPESLDSTTNDGSIVSKLKKTVGAVLKSTATATGAGPALKPPKETPALGLYHPDIELANKPWPETTAEYLCWYDARDADSSPFGFTPLPADAPTVAVLLYRKHVITQQPYLADLVRALEASGVKPVPIFINGVEAHTVVRDLLTTEHEQRKRDAGICEIDSLKPDACVVDAVVSTVGFPLVGGPAGSMEAGRQAEVAQAILTAKNVPYVVAAPLLIQDIKSWTESGVGGLQSTILYALPELDGAIDTVPLGGLCKDDIYLTRERVYALADRLKKWHALRRKKKSDRKLAVMLYGFPPGVGATGTAALLNVPKSLERLLESLRDEGYDLGLEPNEPVPSGEALIEALRALDDGRVVAGGVDAAAAALETLRAEKLALSARHSSETSEETVAARDPLRGVAVAGENVSPKRLKEWISFPESWGPTEFGPIPFLPTPDVLVKRMEQAWGPLDAYNGLATVQGKERGSYVAGLTIGNVFIGVQPALGVEGDPMRLLFERDLTPHPQYAAYYKWLQKAYAADAVLHFGMHGTVEWLPGSPLGNTSLSWSDQLLGAMPNVYVYAANNPSESIVAKRRGYGVIVSHNVPPYGRAGLYRQTAELRSLLSEYREDTDTNFQALAGSVFDLVASAGLDADVPFPVHGAGPTRARLTSETIVLEGDAEATEEPEDPATKKNPEDSEKVFVSAAAFEAYAGELFAYLGVLENRLFSEGLHVLGGAPSDEAAEQYLEAYFGDSLAREAAAAVARAKRGDDVEALRASLERALAADVAVPDSEADRARSASLARLDEAFEIRELLRRNTEELSGALRALNGEYLPPAAGGDLLRDGPGVLPTGRNIHALDPYRMPSPAAADRGKRIAQALLAQHRAANDGAFPETVSVNLWGLDAIKTKGESVGIVLELVGARAVKEGTGRVARYELIPLDELTPPGRPRVDVLCNMSGIFRDSFANVVGLLDDAFNRAADADEPLEKNFIRKHALEMRADGLENASARLFSNPPGDYGSMVNERVGTSEWEDGRELGDTWASRNAYSYGRGGERGAARPEVLQALLRSTERVVQEIDSVEYGLTDIQEYYANTGALVAAANAAKEEAALREAELTGSKTKAFKKTACSIVETFGEDATPRDLDETLRLEYRSKLLNPRWAEAMADQGSGGAFEISQRMTALVGWGATSGFQENWVYDGAHERYVADEAMREKLRRANPQAFRNVLKRMLEAAGRGMWDADEDALAQLRELYSETEDELEGVRTRP